MKTLDTVGTRRHQGAKAKAQQATDGDSIEPAAEPKAAEASGWDSTDGTNAKHNPGGEGSDSKSWWGSEYGNETEHKKTEYNGASHSWSNAAEKSEDESWNVKRRKLEHLESRFWQRW